MKKLLLLSLSILLAVSVVSAGGTCLKINSKDTASYFNELPSINKQLSSCSVKVPKKANALVKDGNILVSITMNSDVTEQFYITINNQKVTTFTKGKPSSYTYEVKLSENTFDSILMSNDALNEVLKGIRNKDIVIRANSFFGRIKWFFAKFFLPKPTPTTTTPTTS